MCILPTEYICVFCVVLTINNDYFLNSINPLVIVMEMQYVSCEVRTEFLSIIFDKFTIESVKERKCLSISIPLG
jgi:hypothetical protein